MITIQNGKLTIPDDERFVGFAGDNPQMQKQFVLMDRVEDGCTYTLCLRFDDDTVRSVPLSAAADGGDTLLTWEIQGEHLYASGITAAQLKIADNDGNIKHTSKDFFIVGTALELDDSGYEAEYVTPSQLRNSIKQALTEIAATAPYIGGDGYWYTYDPQTRSYQKTGYDTGGNQPDSALSDNSENVVGNRYIKRYVDEKAADSRSFSKNYADLLAAEKTPLTRKIAQLPLTSDISALSLADAILPNLYRTGIIPGYSTGKKGQTGIGENGGIFFCNETNEWKRLAEYTDLYEKMDLITSVTPVEAEDMPEGSLFFCGGVLYVKFNDADIALARSNDVYTKAEIDAKLGSIESLLAEL